MKAIESSVAIRLSKNKWFQKVWGLYAVVSTLNVYKKRLRVCDSYAVEMWDQCCDTAIFTCGTGRQKQKTALIVSPRFHPLHVVSLLCSNQQSTS